MGRRRCPRREARGRIARHALLRPRRNARRLRPRPPRYPGRGARHGHRRGSTRIERRVRDDDSRHRHRDRVRHGRRQRRLGVCELQGCLALRRRDRLHDREECRRRAAPRRARAPASDGARRHSRTPAGSTRYSRPVARPRRARVHRRERSVRALLRGPLARDCDAGSLHPQDARRVGGDPRRPPPARANRAARTSPRSLSWWQARRGSSEAVWARSPSAPARR